MRAIGIICEYNPFHAGHAWLIEELRRRFGEETPIVCAMSGNFVQRGDLAVVRKHVRARAALLGGADLVLELPLPWAVSSAEGFGRGGVELLTGTGVVTTLAFGSESADTEGLARIAAFLDSEDYRRALRDSDEEGLPFAARRAAAVRAGLGERAAALLDGANDNLGVEYCRALRTVGADMTPLALPRQGAAHDGGAQDGFASASHVRALLAAGEDASAYLTGAMHALLEEERRAGRAPVFLDTAERAILSRLRGMKEEEFSIYDSGGEGLYHRVYRAAQEAATLEELLTAVKTKRYAHARLRRLLLRAWLDVPERLPPHVPYLRVLGFTPERGRAVLREMKRTASLPILTKPADVRQLGEEAQRVFSMEARATDQYVLAYPSLAAASGGSEWTTDPVIEKRRREQ